MKLFRELVEEVKYIEEATENGEKALYIEGPFIQTNVANRNKRLYPGSMMEGKINKYIEDQVKPNRAFGELGHPASPTINLERVSHMIKSLTKEGNDYIGKAKIITSNPFGAIVMNLMKEEAKLGVSTRGVGSLKLNKDGINEVQDDFHLATAADIVADPSAPDAFVRGIMESSEWVWENGILREAKIDSYKKTIVKAKGRKQIEEAALSVFKDFLDEISRT